MAIPDNFLFSLNDVRVEIGLGATASLQDCFNNANSGGFDATYGTISSSNLRAFRRYDHSSTSLNSFSIDTSSGSGSAAAACAVSYSESILYHDGAGAFPANGDTVYTDSAGTTTFNGGSNYFKTRDGGTFYSIRISAAGVVLAAPATC